MNDVTNALKNFAVTKERLAVLFFSIFFTLVMTDIMIDVNSGESTSHLLTEIALETLIILSASTAMALLFFRYYAEKERRVRAASDLDSIKHNKTPAHELTKEKLREKVDATLTTWGLSKSEKDIAFLLLKGVEIQTIADQRNTSEKTVRNQAQTIYEKSGQGGRAQLAGYFLKDLIF